MARMWSQWSKYKDLLCNQQINMHKRYELLLATVWGSASYVLQVAFLNQKEKTRLDAAQRNC
eukprot:8659056-Prorocentrum_lima.AAC.1